MVIFQFKYIYTFESLFVYEYACTRCIYKYINTYLYNINTSIIILVGMWNVVLLVCKVEK